MFLPKLAGTRLRRVLVANTREYPIIPASGTLVTREDSVIIASGTLRTREDSVISTCGTLGTQYLYSKSLGLASQ